MCLVLENVYEEICNGNAILLTGSGAHIGATGMNNKPLPTAKELSKLLYEKCGISNPPNENDLADAASTFMEMYSEHELVEELKMIFALSGVSENQKKLYNQNWKRVYTTNYDKIPLWATRDSSERRLFPVTLSDPYSEKLLNNRLCVFINGYIDKLDETTLTSEFKLTENSYMKALDLESSYWGKLLDEDLETSNYLVVIGLSLDYDLDLKRLIENKKINDKVVFIQSEGISDYLFRKLSRLGTVYNIGSEKFADNLFEYSKSHTFSDSSDEFYRYKSFEQFYDEYSYKKPNTNVVYDLLMNGTLDTRLWFKERGKYQGVVYRNKLDEVLENIDNGCLITFIHANLGNGKTLFLELLKRRMIRKGYTIYTYTTFYQGITSKEIESISRKKNKTLIIIENYYNFMNEIKQFSLHKDGNIQFVLTSRSVMFDVKFYDVCNYFSIQAGEAQEYNLNYLEHNELVEISKLLSRNGLWGQYSSKSKYQKTKMLAAKDFGNKQFQGILIALIKSTSIRKRIEEVVNNIASQKNKKFEVLILLLLIKVMNLDIKTSEVSKILELNSAIDALFKSDRNIQELLDFSDSSGEFKLKSAITANFVLQQLNCNDAIIKVLTQVAAYFNKYSKIERCENVLKNIVSYSHVKSFLKWDSNKDEFIMEFYENIKELDFYRENTFFWLQFAIVAIRFKRFDLAQTFLNNAYSYYANISDVSPFQVDTQQANLYLLRITDDPNCDVKDLLLKAHEILVKQPESRKDIQSKRLLYFGVYLKKAFIRRVKKEGLEDEFKEYCREAIIRINDYLVHGNVQLEAEKQLKRIVHKLKEIVL